MIIIIIILIIIIIIVITHHADYFDVPILSAAHVFQLATVLVSLPVRSAHLVVEIF